MNVETYLGNIGLVIHSIYNICYQIMEQGFACRGGIAAGKLIHENDLSRMMFGPAFLDAYRLESEHADVSRIILSKKVSRLIEGAKPQGRLKDFFSVYLRRADDGPFMINLFSSFQANAFDLVAEEENTIREIGHKIENLLRETEDRPRLFKKNLFLAKEYNAAIPNTFTPIGVRYPALKKPNKI